MNVNIRDPFGMPIASADVLGPECQVECELNGATVTVRKSSDGTRMIVMINGEVQLEPRAAAVYLVVKDKER